MAFNVLKKQEIFTTNAPARQNVELLAKQRVKWMSDPKSFLITLTIECS